MFKRSSFLRLRVKPLVGVCMITVAGMSLTSCQNDETQQLPNGLKVTPLVNERNDVAQILGVRMWRIQVQLPQADQTLDCTLEVRPKGKPSYSIGGFAVGPLHDSQTEVLVGMHPTNDSWEKDGQVKTFIQMASGGNSTFGTKSNPFKGYGLASGSPVPQQDGSILLMVGSKNHAAMWPSEKENDVALVLLLKPKDIKYPDSLK